MKMSNKWSAQIHFAAFTAWAFSAFLAFSFHHWIQAVISVLVAVAFLLFGIYVFRKPDDPEPPTRGTGGFAAA